MKHGGIIILTIFTLTFSQTSKAQNSQSVREISNCTCETKPILQKIINCDTTHFKNGSMIFWQFNCDSSWLVFCNKNGLKKSIYSLPKPFIEETDRIGYRFIKEYKHSILFQNRQASGGGFPVNYVLLNKENGDIIKDFGTIIFYSNKESNNYVLFLSSDSLNTLTYFDVETFAILNKSIPNGRLEYTVRNSSQMFAEYLFDKPKVRNGILSITYKYLVDTTTQEKWSTDTMTFDLEKYYRNERNSK